MSANPWTRFFWNDWDNDPALRLCSLAAQGLWMRLLCICAKSDPVGYVTVEGNALTHDDLSLLIGRPVSEIVPLLDELSTRGALSRDAKGRIYNRRMVRDMKQRAISEKNGKMGGNPSLSSGKEKPLGVNLDHKPPDKLLTTNPSSISKDLKSLNPVPVSTREDFLNKTDGSSISISSDAIDRARTLAHGWDVYALEQKFIDFCKANTIPKNPDAAFIAWIPKFTKGKALAA